MKRTLIVSIALGATILSFAQDIIVTSDAKKIEAKILEVSKTDIKYKEHDNLNGPTFILGTDEISSIIYSNGKVVLYGTNKPEDIQKKEEEKPTTTLNNPNENAADNIATIVLRSGIVITGELLEMKNKYIAYLDNGIRKTIPASQIESVSLPNGQVRNYANATAVSQNQELTIEQSSSSQKEDKGRIYRDNGQYLYNEVYISTKEVARILERENAAAYKQWKKADGLLIGGTVCIGIGGGLVIGGIFPAIKQQFMPALGVELSALVPLGVGLGLTLGASSHYNKAIDIYNSKYDHAAVQLRWGVSANGVGLALAF
ncbi:MAG: hypothetical protein J5965_08805 [Aeriscardovia sp.]|nr:hypothetical protein [Aeriscardovia sp.]